MQFLTSYYNHLFSLCHEISPPKPPHLFEDMIHTPHWIFYVGCQISSNRTILMNSTTSRFQSMSRCLGLELEWITFWYKTSWKIFFIIIMELRPYHWIFTPHTNLYAFPLTFGFFTRLKKTPDFFSVFIF